MLKGKVYNNDNNLFQFREVDFFFINALSQRPSDQ
jgi:hypothetical protein